MESIQLYAHEFYQVCRKPRVFISQAINNLGIKIVFMLLIWQVVMIWLGTESPLVVVLSGSMEPSVYRGDCLLLSGLSEKTLLAPPNVIVFTVEGRNIPIVHRILRRHVAHNTPKIGTSPAIRTNFVKPSSKIDQTYTGMSNRVMTPNNTDPDGKPPGGFMEWVGNIGLIGPALKTIKYYCYDVTVKSIFRFTGNFGYNFIPKSTKSYVYKKYTTEFRPYISNLLNLNFDPWLNSCNLTTNQGNSRHPPLSLLTKGDNNALFDHGLYSHNQLFISRKNVAGRVWGTWPKMPGMFVILLSDYPWLKGLIFGGFLIMGMIGRDEE